MDSEQETTDNEQTLEATATETEKQKEFDKERQKADQELANKVKEHPAFRRVAAEKEHLNRDLQAIRDEHENLKAQLQQLQAGKTAADEVSGIIPELGEDATVEDYGQAIKAVGKVVVDLRKELAAVQTRTEQAETKRKQEREMTAAQREQNQRFEKVCKRLEAKHGPGLRNRAVEMMEQRASAEGEPADLAEATLLLDDCFASAKAERDAKPKKGKAPVGDVGGGGHVRFGEVQIKAGSLDEVAEQYARLT